MGTKEIEEMQQSLIGKTVKGVLIRRRQNAYFVKWSQKHKDVYVSAKNVERCLGPKKQPGMVVVVKCTITGFGPSSASIHKQNPLATELTVATRYPSKNANNPFRDAERTNPEYTRLHDPLDRTRAHVSHRTHDSTGGATGYRLKNFMFTPYKDFSNTSYT